MSFLGVASRLVLLTSPARALMRDGEPETAEVNMEGAALTWDEGAEMAEVTLEASNLRRTMFSVIVFSKL